MNRVELIKRVRSMTRDLSNSIFREEDVIDYLNESIDRFKQVIPELRGMVSLSLSEDSPTLLPSEYHYLLSVYSASRCFSQDERHYQATNMMNEFETKLEELRNGIENGRIEIKDSNGVVVTSSNVVDYVTDNYFGNSYTTESFDLPSD